MSAPTTTRRAPFLPLCRACPHREQRPAVTYCRVYLTWQDPCPTRLREDAKAERERMEAERVPDWAEGL